jgi:adenine-specific DNA-methyltransferase
MDVWPGNRLLILSSATRPTCARRKIRPLKPALKEQYKCYTGIADLYVYFFEAGVNLLREGGVLCYICSNKYFRANYGEKAAKLFEPKNDHYAS